MVQEVGEGAESGLSALTWPCVGIHHMPNSCGADVDKRMGGRGGDVATHNCFVSRSDRVELYVTYL